MRAVACAGVLSGLLAAPASALPVVGPFTPGHIGSLDDRIALLVSAHPGETAQFFDLFTFEVDALAGFLALTLDLTTLDPTIAPEDQATLFGIALLDSGGNVLALDDTPGDGLGVLALLPTAGIYGLLISGVAGNGLGAYAALVASERIAVSAPPALALTLLGLSMAALARAGRRRRAGEAVPA